MLKSISYITYEGEAWQGETIWLTKPICKLQKVLWIQPLGPHSQPFSFFITYKSANKARVHYTGLERLARVKQSCLLSQAVRYKNCVVNTAPVAHLQPFSLFVTYKWAHYARTLHYTKLERLARDKQSSLLGQFVCFKDSVVNTAPGTIFTALLFPCNLQIVTIS
jgi:hypothetical protein